MPFAAIVESYRGKSLAILVKLPSAFYGSRSSYLKAAGERAEMDRKALGSDHLRTFSSRKMRLIRRTALLLFLSGSGRLPLELFFY